MQSPEKCEAGQPKTVATEQVPLSFKNRVGPTVYILARIVMIPHYHVFEKTTYRPIKRITSSTTPEEAHAHIIEWCKRKTNEANYVQVAGAVMFASVVSCLGWDFVMDSHWLGPASFYVCILLSLSSIFTAAQQAICLPDKDGVKDYEPEQAEILKMSLTGTKDDEPSLLTLFAWQTPIMLMGYSVFFFVMGMTVVVVSPLAFDPHWGGAAKTLIMYFTIMLSIGLSAAVTTSMVYRFRV